MPNLIPISTVHAVAAMLRDGAVMRSCLDAIEGIAHARRNDARFSQADQLAYSTMVAGCRLRNDSAFSDPLEGWRSWRKVVKDDDGTERIVYSEPEGKPHTASDPRKTDADVKLNQLYRITGLKGTAVLSRADLHGGKGGTGRMVTVNLRETRNVPSNLSGLPPSMDLCVPQATDGTDMTITGSEIRFLRRYKDGMRGKQFADAMERERKERNLAWWRAANPWIPCDSHGKPWEGKSYNRADGIGERIYADGTLLTERRVAWESANAESNDKRAHSEAERLRMIEELAAEQAGDDADTRKRLKRVRAENIERTKALKF